MDMQDIAQIKLPAALDLAAAEGFLGAMRARVDAGTPFQLDASEVETLTLPCMQIILATQRSAVPAPVVNASEAFNAAFADVGLDFVAGEPAVAIDSAPAQADAEESSTPLDIPMEETAMPKRILTIDDSKTIRDMLKFTLLDAGFEVAQAVDGQDGVDVLAREKFDVVITDINMPKMDGYGVIRHMRSKPEFDKTPILVLTTESDGDKRNIARDAGATGWLVKPFDPAALIATINKVAP